MLTNMSMSNEIDYNNYICGCESRLAFGVPLEDVSPCGDLHPSLKLLFNKTYKYFIFSNVACPLECLKNSMELSTTFHINNIIKALTYRMPLPWILSFETLMQTLRYFLSSLPIPLLPKYTYCRDFQWLALSSQCKALIEQRFMNKKLDIQLKDAISLDLLRLPRVNLLLIGYFVNFLRSLVRYGKHAQRYNKKAANILINYFAGSIFIRPCDKNKSKRFHPLMLFMIVKWPHIQQRCIEIHPQCFQAKTPDYLSPRNESNNIASSVKNELTSTLSTIEEIDETTNYFNLSISSPTISKASILNQKNLLTSNESLIIPKKKLSVYTQTFDLSNEQKPKEQKQQCDSNNIGVQVEYFEIKDDLYAIKDKLEVIKKSPGIKIKIDSNKIKRSLNFHKKFSIDSFLSRNKNSNKNNDDSYQAGDYGNNVVDYSPNNEEIVNFKLNETELSSEEVSFTPHQSFLSNNTLNTFIDQEIADTLTDNIEHRVNQNSESCEAEMITKNENVIEIKSVPSSINSNSPETHENDYTAKDLLNSESRQRKSFINLIKLKGNLSFVKQFKNCTLIKRVRSEEFFRRHFNYIKIPNKKFFTMS